MFEVEELQDKIDDAVDGAIPESTKPSGSGGGSGGGGSSGIGSAKNMEFGAPADTTEFVKGEVSIFTDIASVEWAAESINELTKIGVINGKAEGIFAPNDNVTRE